MSDHTFFDSTVESELRESGVYASVTKGRSMRPLFKTNRDVVILKRCDSEPGKYDVVLYRTRDGKYLLHRIIGVKENEFIIRGDNTYLKEHVAKDRIMAVLTEYNRKGKRRTTSSLSFRLYSRLWNFIYPVRYVFHKTYILSNAIYRKIFKREENKQ